MQCLGQGPAAVAEFSLAQSRAASAELTYHCRDLAGHIPAGKLTNRGWIPSNGSRGSWGDESGYRARFQHKCEGDRTRARGALPARAHPESRLLRKLHGWEWRHRSRLRHCLLRKARPHALGIRIAGKEALPGGRKERVVLRPRGPHRQPRQAEGKLGLADAPLVTGREGGPRKTLPPDYRRESRGESIGTLAAGRAPHVRWKRRPALHSARRLGRAARADSRRPVRGESAILSGPHHDPRGGQRPDGISLRRLAAESGDSRGKVSFPAAPRRADRGRRSPRGAGPVAAIPGSRFGICTFQFQMRSLRGARPRSGRKSLPFPCAVPVWQDNPLEGKYD